MDSDDEFARRRERERATKAQQILDNPLWGESWAELDARLTQAWKMSNSGQRERREMIYMQILAAAEVRGHIETILRTGTFAEMQLDEHTRSQHN